MLKSKGKCLIFKQLGSKHISKPSDKFELNLLQIPTDIWTFRACRMVILVTAIELFSMRLSSCMTVRGRGEKADAQHTAHSLCMTLAEVPRHL